MRRITLFFVCFLGLSTFVTPPSRADNIVEITQGNLKPVPTGMPDLFSRSQQEKRIAEDILKVAKADTNGSGLIRSVTAPGQTFAEHNHDKPSFKFWKQKGAKKLVTGKVFVDRNQTMTLHYRIFDVNTGSELKAGAISSKIAAWRKVAHQFADEVYHNVTGESPYFNTKLAFISETGPQTKRVKRLTIMDQDGANEFTLSTGRNDLILMPRFSPDGKKVVYLAFRNHNPQVFYVELATGKEESLGTFPGMTFSPSFSPDGKTIIFSQSLHGVSSIYTLNLDTRKVTRLTKMRSIDVSPCYSPDGKRITFTSDRSGRPQIYVMDKDGRNVTRISDPRRGVYSTPSWSPRGDYIAFTRQYERRFYIGLMRPDGSGERFLANGWLVEGPSWAPNGRVITYTEAKGNGANHICTIDLLGVNKRIVQTKTSASDPAWSPIWG